MVLPPRSGPDQAGDRLGRLADLRVRHPAPLGGRLGDAMAEMVLHQAQRHRLQRPGRRRHLGQDVDAVLVVLDHLLQAADLALDAAQPPEVGLLVRGVSVHADLPRCRLSTYHTPAWYSCGLTRRAWGYSPRPKARPPIVTMWYNRPMTSAHRPGMM